MLSLLLAAVTGVGLGILLMLPLVRRRARTRQQRAERMQQTARRYALGDRSREVPDYGDDDLGDTARAFDQAIRERSREAWIHIQAGLIEGLDLAETPAAVLAEAAGNHGFQLGAGGLQGGVLGNDRVDGFGIHLAGAAR